MSNEGFFYLLIMVAVYFIPAIIASARVHKNVAAIGCLNTFLGWSVIGWIVALVWSFTDNVKGS